MANEWQSVAGLPPLGPGEVHLWRVSLIDAIEEADSYKKNLSATELERAGRIRAGQVRTQFVMARACLRVLLGNILGLAPCDVPMTLTPYGKPETSAFDGRPVFFNVAHSRATVLIALCRSTRVGVDLEYIDRATSILDVAQSAFTSDEFRQLEEVSDAAVRRTAFFRCWTRKEAIVKADGRGLSLPLNSLTVPLLSPASRTPVVVTEADRADSTWFVSDIDLGEGIAGAFAVAAPMLEVRSLDFPLHLLAISPNR